jgi:hypothetical protein
MNSSVYYFSTLFLCCLFGELSTSLLIQFCAAAVAIAVFIGKSIIDSLSYNH